MLIFCPDKIGGLTICNLVSWPLPTHVNIFFFASLAFFCHLCDIIYHTLGQFIHLHVIHPIMFLASPKQGLGLSQLLTQSKASGQAR